MDRSPIEYTVSDLDVVIDNPCYSSETKLSEFNPTALQTDNNRPLPTPMDEQSALPLRMFSGNNFEEDEGIQAEPYSKLNSSAISPVFPDIVDDSNMYDKPDRLHEYEELPYVKSQRKLPHPMGFSGGGSGDSGIAVDPREKHSPTGSPTCAGAETRFTPNNNHRYPPQPGVSSQKAMRYKNAKKNDKLYDCLDTPVCRSQENLTAQYSVTSKGRESCTPLITCLFCIIFILLFASLGLSVYTFLQIKSSADTSSTSAASTSVQNYSSEALDEAILKIEELEELYSGALQRLDDYDDVIDELKSNISVLLAETESNSDDIITLQSDITGVGSDLSVLSTDVAGLNFTDLSQCQFIQRAGAAGFDIIADVNYEVEEGWVVMSAFCTVANGYRTYLDITYLDTTSGYECSCVGSSDEITASFPGYSVDTVTCYLNIYMCPDKT